MTTPLAQQEAARIRSRPQKRVMVAAALAEEDLAEDLAARQGEAASLEDQPCLRGCAARTLDDFH